MEGKPTVKHTVSQKAQIIWQRYGHSIVLTSFAIYLLAYPIVFIFYTTWEDGPMTFLLRESRIMESFYYVVISIFTYQPFLGFPSPAWRFGACIYFLVQCAVLGLVLSAAMEKLFHVHMEISSHDLQEQEKETYYKSKAMSTDILATQKKRYYRTMYMCIATFFVFLLGGTLMMCLLEDWHFTEGFYYVSLAIGTCSLGDLGPTKPVSALCASLLLVLCVVAAVPAMAYLVSLPSQLRTLEKHHDRMCQFGHHITGPGLKKLAGSKVLCRLRTANQIKRNEVSRQEFAAWALIEAEIVDRAYVDQILAAFDDIDKTGDGVLNHGDFLAKLDDPATPLVANP